MSYLAKSLLAFALGITVATAAISEDLKYFLKDGVRYNPSVVKPHEIIGHNIGEQPIRHDTMVSYINALASASDRMKSEVIGYSYEKRPILFITVTSPENHARLDEIRTNHLLRSNPATADQASNDLPVVTWLNYGVHGAESSGMDAVVPTLYHLAAAKGDAIDDTLKNSVILITAVFNPDGHARRASWQTGYGSVIVNKDPANEVHNQMWPGGRVNHYWFDLNRQWLLQTQPESQAWLTQWHKWKPQVSSDFHEMGANASYYFHPGQATRKFPLIPNKAREIALDIAEYHAGYMDKAGKLYFSQEGYDNFYIGKGSTYPQVNGGIGFLFEAGAQMAIARETDQGIKTLSNNILIHFNTSLTTIEGAKDLRLNLHNYQRNYYTSVAGLVKKDSVKAYVFTAPEDPARIDLFLDLMARHKIKVHHLAKDTKIAGSSYRAADSYIVPMNQAQYRMAKAVFMRITDFEDKVFYDVSGWTLPLVYGLKHDAVGKEFNTKLLGGEASAKFAKAPVPDVAPYAYIFSWSDYYAPRALNRLLSEGVLARVAMDKGIVQTTKGNVAFERGAIIVGQDHQTVSNADVHKIMLDIASQDGITVHAATSGLTPKGGELGGRNSVKDLSPVNALMVVGPGVSPYDAGEVWHMMDVRMEMPLTMVRKDRLSRVKWHRYSHLILVGGKSSFDDATQKKVKAWLNAGGTIVASEQGAVWAEKTFLKDAKGKEEVAAEEVAESDAPRLDYSVKEQKDAEHIIGGAIMGGNLDISHPIGFGYVRDDIATIKAGTHLLKRSNDHFGNVAVYNKDPLLSGYTSPKRLAEIGGTSMVVAERVGQGSVILFADNPNFRATLLGNSKMFMNALFFSKAFSNARKVGDAVDMEAMEE